MRKQLEIKTGALKAPVEAVEPEDEGHAAQRGRDYTKGEPGAGGGWVCGWAGGRGQGGR